MAVLKLEKHRMKIFKDPKDRRITNRKLTIFFFTQFDKNNIQLTNQIVFCPCLPRFKTNYLFNSGNVRNVKIAK